MDLVYYMKSINDSYLDSCWGHIIKVSTCKIQMIFSLMDIITIHAT